MIPLITDSQFNSLALIIIAIVGIIPATIAAVYSRRANQNSAEAKTNSAGALHEVKANGGMDDPDPTLKDYVKFVGEVGEKNDRRLDRLEDLLDQHLKHSKIMDAALAEVFFVVKPDLKKEDFINHT